MIRFSILLDSRRALRATRRVRRRIPVATSQILNRQRSRLRTMVTRKLSATVGVKPQRRIRRRILTPRSLRATPRRLISAGLTLFESFPTRYFPRGLKGGARKVLEPAGRPTRKGGRTIGGAFEATMPSGHTAQFRRVRPRKRSTNSAGRRTWLPIAPVEVVNLESPGYRARLAALVELAREFPETWTKRMRAETRRVFRR